MQASRDAILRLYPNTKFEVVYWPAVHWAAETSNASIAELLRSGGLSVHPVREFLHGDMLQYVLSRDDIHPNALGHRLMADFVVSRLLADRPD